MAQLKLSVLDLCPVLSGLSASDSLQESLKLARWVEELGYHRYWFAEHHNMEGIGSSSPEVLIAHIAGATKKMRVGSGGIMLPNHATLHVAEVFRTLEALHPGRIDLGLGRAPGSGSKAAHFLRGHRGLSADEFPSEMDQLLQWLSDEKVADVAAVPTKVAAPELWILGSSDWGALYAGHKGLPYAFAQHFSHLPATEMLRLYHETFRPSPWLSEPQAMMACHIICADTDEEARELALSSELSFSLFVQTGQSIPLPTVAEAKSRGYSEREWREIRAGSMPKFVGSPETIKKLLAPYLKSHLFQELMVLTMIHDQEKRRSSYKHIVKLFE